jgi:hypothetical protein
MWERTQHLFRLCLFLVWHFQVLTVRRTHIPFRICVVLACLFLPP